MTRSTARAYPNSDGGKSENPSLFSLRQLVESSAWPALYRALLMAMLEKNRFGTELFRSQRKLSRELGVSYSTVRRMVDRLERGHKFGRKHVTRCEGVLSQLYEANKRPGGRLRRTATYQLHPHRLKPRPTEQEYEESSSGALCPFPPQSAPPAVSPAPAPPAKALQHRSPQRESKPQQPKFSRRECQKFAAQLVYHMRGCSGTAERLTFRAALDFVSAQWKREPESAIEALKFWKYRFEEMEEGP